MTRDEIDDATLHDVVDAVQAWYSMQAAAQERTLGPMVAAMTGSIARR